MAWIDLLICYFLGIFGVHKFREKKMGLGILYLFTFGLFGFGWLYDCIKYLLIAIKTLKPQNIPSTSSSNHHHVVTQPAEKVVQSPKKHPKRTTLLIILGCICFVILLVALSSNSYVPEDADNTLQSSSINSSPDSQHTHTFAPATCNTPKKCTICDITEGSPLEHSWSNATCTTPKTCSTCGKTDGNPTAHSWKNATCTSPKTCSTCGATEGGIKSHNYSNGKCTSCGSKDPNYTSETMVWIPTNGGTKYHSKATCSQMENPEHVTESEAISRGFDPCKRCYG